jgi:hypothetical protein
VTIPDTVPQGSEIPEGLMNNPVYIAFWLGKLKGGDHLEDLCADGRIILKFISQK